jgi:hypothetical protein
MSLSYFTDTEGAPANVLASGLLDLTVNDPGAEIISCGGVAVASTSMDTNAAGFPSLISASTTSLSGDPDLCAALELTVRYDTATDSTTIYYPGPLAGFAANTMGTGTLRFIVDLAADAGPFPDGASCTMTYNLMRGSTMRPTLSELHR